MTHRTGMCRWQRFVLLAAGALLLGTTAAGADAQTQAPAPAQAESAAATAPAGASPESKKSKLELAWENRLLTVDVADTDVRNVIKALSEKTGVEIKIYEGVTGSVTLRLEKAPLEKVVDTLLSAVGQRNYLMVFDGGGLTKMSIVPKGTGGPGLAEEAKRVKVKGRLRNGKEIEYYPNEIVVGLRGFRQDAQGNAERDAYVRNLEREFGLSLVSLSKVNYIQVCRFRVLNGQEVLDLYYRLRKTEPNVAFVTPNGLGPLTAEMPIEDTNVAEEATASDQAEMRRRGLSEAQFKMARYPFLKIGRVDNEMDAPRPYVQGQVELYIQGNDTESIGYDDVLWLAGQNAGSIVLYKKSQLGDIYHLLFRGMISLEDHQEKISTLRSSSIMKRARNPLTRVSHMFWGWGSLTPNDEYIGLQWYLGKIRAKHAWDDSAGQQSVKVAILDTGVDILHDDLKDQVDAASADFSTGVRLEGKQNVVDTSGHGTKVAGVLGAKTNNDVGIAGTAGGNNDSEHGVKLLILKVHHLGNDQVHDAVQYAVSQGAKVLNLSENWMDRSSPAVDAFLNAVSSNIVLVGSADNVQPPYLPTFDRFEPPFPAEFDKKILIVAGTNAKDHKCPTSRYGSKVNVSAPGCDIYTTDKGNDYVTTSGTSLAAPQVAGLAALLLSQNSSMTNTDVYARIKSTADPLPVSDPPQPWDGKMGKRINMYSALRGASDEVKPQPPGNIQLTHDKTNIRITWTATDDDEIGESLVYRRENTWPGCTTPETIEGIAYCLVAELEPDQRPPHQGLFYFADTSLHEDHTYYYRIIAVDKTGNKSQPSAELGPAHHTLAPAARLTWRPHPAPRC